MTGPQPPVRTSRTVAIVCAVAAGLLTAIVAVIGAVGVYEWATSPVLTAPDDGAPSFGPIPASTAGPAPHTPAVLLERPVTGWGPRAATTPEETR